MTYKDSADPNFAFCLCGYSGVSSPWSLCFEFCAERERGSRSQATRQARSARLWRGRSKLNMADNDNFSYVGGLRWTPF